MCPVSFRPLISHKPSPVSADIMDALFNTQQSAVESTKSRTDEHIVPFWKDDLQDVENEYKCEIMAQFDVCFRN